MSQEEASRKNKEWCKAWKAANKEKTSAYRKEYYQRNKEKMKKQMREWSKANLGRVNYHSAKRRASKKTATMSWTDENYIKDLYQNAHEASQLFQKIGIDVLFHVDHIVPLQGKNVCGLHTQDNLQILTHSENLSKGNRWV